ncbi:DUF3108 domain-containing protein [Devosia sp.]|uniref:DUF3108 domain-containing protein n=1 Tax=Devosia sp. TaxID=1871048 RepID=UPI003A904F1A
MLSALFRRVALTMPLLLGLASATSAAEVQVTARYSVTLGGTQIALATVKLETQGDKYSMILDARVSGLATLVATGTARATSRGAVQNSGLRSAIFNMVTRAGGGQYASDISFSGNGVESFVITPPIINNIDRVAIERKHLTASNDMLAPFVLRGDGLNAKLCERKMPIFTGTERFDLTMRYARGDTATSKRTGYQGPVIVCAMRYTPVSGHYTTSEITNYLANNDRILIWYAPLEAEGWYIPYRALVTTAEGDLSMVLTDLDQ